MTGQWGREGGTNKGEAVQTSGVERSGLSQTSIVREGSTDHQGGTHRPTTNKYRAGWRYRPPGWNGQVSQTSIVQVGGTDLQGGTDRSHKQVSCRLAVQTSRVERTGLSQTSIVKYRGGSTDLQGGMAANHKAEGGQEARLALLAVLQQSPCAPYRILLPRAKRPSRALIRQRKEGRTEEVRQPKRQHCFRVGHETKGGKEGQTTDPCV
jgi:hypothetical protein